MADLTFLEKTVIKRLFRFRGGYVFIGVENYNKNTTRDLILETTSIDIYQHPEYQYLSQEKCITKLLEEGFPLHIARLLQTMLAFFEHAVVEIQATDEQDIAIVKAIIERLSASINTLTSSLPPVWTESMKLLRKEIGSHILSGTPELVLDRLHTYATTFLREVCQGHSLPVANNSQQYPLHSLVGKVSKYYEGQSCVSAFSVSAIKCSVSLFDGFNAIRNNNSYAHPNPILSRDEAEYVVKCMMHSLEFIVTLENQLEREKTAKPSDVHLDLPF